MGQKFSIATIAPALVPLFVQDNGGGIPWWVWLIIIIILLIVFLVALVRTQEPGPPLPERGAEPEPPVVDEPVVEEPIVEPVVEEPVVEKTEAVAEVIEEAAEEAPPDDLKRIEGIGPKISSILQGAGVTTYVKLADASVESLDKILDEAKIRIANPSTWPEQAKLAAADKWDELGKLQDSLKGGRRG
jgi:predicted flap endonuclease-1-like 5' DNA nuclease